MPQANNIVIADAVPANRTYSPMVIDRSSATLIDRTTTTFVGGQSTIILALDPVNGKRKTDRITVRLNMPKNKVVDGVDAVESVGRFVGEYIIPEGWTQTDRNNLESLVKNLFANANVTGYVRNRDPMW